MAVYNCVLSSALSQSDYSWCNDILGQIKAALLQDPNVTIISDNNPAGNIQRQIIYKVGNSTHYFKMLAQTTAIYAYVRNNANTADMGSAAYTGSSVFYQGCTLKFLYSSSIHMLSIFSFAIGYSNCFSIAYTLLSTGDWAPICFKYAGVGSFGGVILNGSDSNVSLMRNIVSSIYSDASGYIYLVKVTYGSSYIIGNLNSVYCAATGGGSGGDMPLMSGFNACNAWYTDETGANYYLNGMGLLIGE